MSKLTWGILIAGGAFLVMSGVVQVNFNSENLPGTPEISGGGTFEKVRSYGVRSKRVGQMFLVDNEKERIDLSLDFVEADANRLDTLLEKAEEASTLVPQAAMLLDSLDRAKELSRAVSPEVLAAAKDRSQEAFSVASKSINNLHVAEAEDALTSERLATLTESLTIEVGGLTDIAPQVAGTSDGEEEGSTEETPEEPKPTEIPLQF